MEFDLLVEVNLGLIFCLGFGFFGLDFMEVRG